MSPSFAYLLLTANALVEVRSALIPESVGAVASAGAEKEATDLAVLVLPDTSVTVTAQLVYV